MDEYTIKYTKDPLNEQKYKLSPHIVKKYPGRVLILCSDKCADFCEFCFRQHTIKNLPPVDWHEIVDHLVKDSSLFEVILSGGDPLSLSNEELRHALTQISAVQHIKFLRIHTRFPILNPSRVDDEFLNILSEASASSFKIIVVLHINHADEFKDERCKQSIINLRQSGVTLLSQSVLLNGVNNSEEALRDLFILCCSLGVTPYYLHLLDKVEGSSRFYSSEEEAKVLIQKLRSSLPGYMVPRLVREDEGVWHKTVVC